MSQVLFIAAVTLGWQSVPAISAGSVEALRAQSSHQHVADVPGTKLSLRGIRDGEVEMGTEGIPYYGSGVVHSRPLANSSTFPVLQVIDEGNLLIEANGQVWWVEMKTEGIADETDLNLGDKVFRAMGTKRYSTALGAKTVFHLKHVRDAEPEKPPTAARTWTDETGKFTVEAEFVGFEDGQVKLLKANGKTISVPPSRLSAKDVRWYRNYLKSQRAQKAR